MGQLSFSISLTGALVRSNKASRVHTLLPQLTGLFSGSYIHGMARERFSRDIYECIRSATSSDIDSLVSLIAPLEIDGTLLARPMPKLLEEVKRGCFYVLSRDDLPIACASLKRLDAAGTLAELGCLVVA